MLLGKICPFGGFASGNRPGQSAGEFEKRRSENRFAESGQTKTKEDKNKDGINFRFYFCPFKFIKYKREEDGDE